MKVCTCFFVSILFFDIFFIYIFLTFPVFLSIIIFKNINKCYLFKENEMMFEHTHTIFLYEDQYEKIIQNWIDPEQFNFSSSNGNNIYLHCLFKAFLPTFKKYIYEKTFTVKWYADTKLPFLYLFSSLSLSLYVFFIKFYAKWKKSILLNCMLIMSVYIESVRDIWNPIVH